VWRSVREHGDTKTQLSRRTLSLPAHTEEFFREHRTRQSTARDNADELWQENGLVFCTGLGTKLGAGNVRRQFKAVMEGAGLGRDWTPQELRHTFVSLLPFSGMAVEEIARLAGHSSTRTTEVIYRQELRAVLTRGAELMDALLD